MEPPRTELLVRLLSGHQEQLFRYVFALVPHEADARDVLQETCVALYRKFDAYDAAQPFLPWAQGFAFLEVLKHRERAQRKARLFARELLERLAAERQAHEPVLDARLTALEACLRELPPADRALIRQRYEADAGTDKLVEEFAPSRRTLFRKLDRIRRWLYECISRRVAAAG
jgi:RNA polymerase sigma-70 factor (ECF subfamily)